MSAICGRKTRPSAHVLMCRVMAVWMAFFSVAVCAELGVELSRHRSRSFDEMGNHGDDLSSFDLIVALSPSSHARAQELTNLYHIDVMYWPIQDPTATGETREAKLTAYRAARDQIVAHLTECWGAPKETQS